MVKSFLSHLNVLYDWDNVEDGKQPFSHLSVLYNQIHVENGEEDLLQVGPEPVPQHLHQEDVIPSSEL